MVKDGKLYRIPRRFEHSQAHKAGIDFRIGEAFVPETADTSLWDNVDEIPLVFAFCLVSARKMSLFSENLSIITRKSEIFMVFRSRAKRKAKKEPYFALKAAVCPKT